MIKLLKEGTEKKFPVIDKNEIKELNSLGIKRIPYGQTDPLQGFTITKDHYVFEGNIDEFWIYLIYDPEFFGVSSNSDKGWYLNAFIDDENNQFFTVNPLTLKQCIKVCKMIASKFKSEFASKENVEEFVKTNLGSGFQFGL